MAGGVRVRDILNPRTQLKGVQLQPRMLLVLRKSILIQAVLRVLACTENAEHETIARKALEASKHTLVEFPLTVSYEAVGPLYKLAEEKVVLFEENIAVLLGSHLALKKAVQKT